jgi:hypothetical protein
MHLHPHVSGREGGWRVVEGLRVHTNRQQPADGFPLPIPRLRQWGTQERPPICAGVSPPRQVASRRCLEWRPAPHLWPAGTKPRPGTEVVFRERFGRFPDELRVMLPLRYCSGTLSSDPPGRPGVAFRLGARQEWRWRAVRGSNHCACRECRCALGQPSFCVQAGVRGISQLPSRPSCTGRGCPIYEFTSAIQRASVGSHLRD